MHLPVVHGKQGFLIAPDSLPGKDGISGGLWPPDLPGAPGPGQRGPGGRTSDVVTLESRFRRVVPARGPDTRCTRGTVGASCPPPCVLDVLYLDLDVDARREVEALERVDRLWRVLHDVDQPLVHLHLEVLTAVFVLVR